MTSQTPPVTVIVPCHNEASGLPALLDRLDRLHHQPATADWKFLFVDDGSNDDTLAVLIQAE
ncbi:MAG TPA: glycosyltransferase, partial [Terriglobales bacterium]|nr:glycosyltransferase [Terriglobales bacterium]